MVKGTQLLVAPGQRLGSADEYEVGEGKATTCPRLFSSALLSLSLSSLVSVTVAILRRTLFYCCCLCISYSVLRRLSISFSSSSRSLVSPSPSLSFSLLLLFAVSFGRRDDRIPWSCISLFIPYIALSLKQ